MIILAILLLVLLYGVFVEPHRMKIKEEKLVTKAALGLRLAQFSDTHFTWHTSYRRFRKFAAHLEKTQPDLILFTGDLFDRVAWAKKQDLSALTALLSSLSAPLGKFAILGNHDFEKSGAKENADFVRQVLEKCGFVVLQNQSLEIPLPQVSSAVTETEKSADAILSAVTELENPSEPPVFMLSGIDDMREGQPNFAIKAPASRFSLLMIHEPDALNQLENLDAFDLVIAGHSHGGQIRIGDFRLHNDGSKSYDSGPYTISEKTKLYVNNGIGLTFLPIRIGVPPELTYYDI